MRGTDTPALLHLFKVQGKWLKWEDKKMSLGWLHVHSRPRQDCDGLYYMFDIQELFQVAGKFA
jgi:hypothetical protein